MTGKDEREARLAAQLRANLKRRKAQARGEVAAMSSDPCSRERGDPGEPRD
jgi:hypothetical protein